MKYHVKVFLKWLCKKWEIQCSGKRFCGFALEHCKLPAFHDGVCVTHQNEQFYRPRQPQVS